MVEAHVRRELERLEVEYIEQANVTEDDELADLFEQCEVDNGTAARLGKHNADGVHIVSSRRWGARFGEGRRVDRLGCSWRGINGLVGLLDSLKVPSLLGIFSFLMLHLVLNLHLVRVQLGQSVRFGFCA